MFYHSYSLAAIIYEVHAAVAGLLLGYDAYRAPLPRLQVGDFAETPDAAALIRHWGGGDVGGGLP